ncbi:hypothetical protein OQA88_1182 [Cercophora sp. LCS_1]
MFSADITWTPVAEVGGFQRATNAKPPSRRPSRSETERVVDASADDVSSVRSSGNSRKQSVFRWRRGKKPASESGGGVPSSSSHRATSSVGSHKQLSIDTVAEMSEDRGPERHELPASDSEPSHVPTRRTKIPAGRFPPVSPYAAPTTPRYRLPSSTQAGEEPTSPSDSDQPAWTKDMEFDSTLRNPEEFIPSSRGSNAASSYTDSSPRTTVFSPTTRSSIPSGLSPPPKHAQRPVPRNPPPPATSLETLIARMPFATPHTILARLTETYNPLPFPLLHDLNLEKDLWLLAHLHNLLPASPLPTASRILDIASPVSSLLQLSVTNPTARIAHLSNSPPPHPLANVASLSFLSLSDVSFPLADSAFDYARLTHVVAGLFSPPQIKTLIREAHRVLAVRGVLEFRVVDPMLVDAGEAVRKWVEEELLVALEGEFRCTRPGVLVPLWMREVGFQMGEVEVLEVGVGGGEGEGEGEETSVEEVLGAEVGRWLLRGQYPFVERWCWEEGDGGRWRVLTIRGLKT